ncbi:MAG: FHA domain-containing protein [Bdellovibrionaceae bacterium]|nr:FHA domain-containing protein [Pseudobdellovibrionaceae bacterium]
MSNAAPQLGPSVRFTLTVKSGPDSGRSYQLLPPKVTIGRDPGNHIPLKDPRVSRNQMAVEFRPDRIVAIDLSSRRNVLINGKASPETPLKDGDLIAIGESELVFRIEVVAPRTAQLQMVSAPAPHQHHGELQLERSHRPGGLGPHVDPRRSAPSPRRSVKNSEGAKKFRFYLILIIVAAGVVYMLQGPSAPPKKEPGLRTSEEIEAEIRSSEERQVVLSKQREFKSEAERARYEEAQTHYMQGFRDFQKENYSRAMRSFETARAIDPGHEMAKRYYTLATRRRDEFVERHLIEGRRYKEKNMYSRCVAAIDKALKTLGEMSEQNLKVKEAKVLRDECEALMKARF